MFRFLLAFILGVTLTLGWFHKQGDLPSGIRTIEALLHPVFHKDTVYQYSNAYKEDPLLILALIKTESHFFKKAKSSRGAIGLMQLLPATAKEIARELNIKDFKTQDLEDPKINIQFGTYYLAKLHKEFGQDTVAALAAYNAGKKNVKDWLKLHKTKTLEMNQIEFKETRNFVEDVLTTQKQLKRLQKIRSALFKKAVKKQEPKNG